MSTTALALNGRWPAFWPGGDRLLLLQSALLPLEAARGAWRRWRGGHPDFGNVDHASFRLLPFLCGRLREMGEPDPQEGLLRGLYKRAWFSNHLLLRHLFSTVDALERAGVDVVLMKGVASFPHYGGDVGLRPVGDADLIVARADAVRAIDVVLAEGWKPTPPYPVHEIKGRWLREAHGWNFRRADAEIDLHWHALHHDRSPFFDQHVWRHRRVARIGARDVAIPGATEHLLMACVHASFYSVAAPCNWAVDAALLLHRAGASVDWDRLIEVATARRLVLPVREALLFLDQMLAAPVPAEVHARLAAIPVFDVERIEHAGIFVKPARRSAAERHALQYMSDARRAEGPELHYQAALGAQALRLGPPPATAPTKPAAPWRGRRVIPRAIPAWRQVRR